jgi:p-hydroxybenzoate 3-monooxygenase
VLKDLLAARVAAGQDLRLETRATDVDTAGDRPRVLAETAQGERLIIEADFVVGADGSRSVVRAAVTGSHTAGYFREYPFAWFGVLCEAPPSSRELIYSNSPDGFALVSQRSETVQRMYFQCDPEDDPSAYTEDQLWEILQRRVPGTTLNEGPIFQRDVLRFRSFVAAHMRRGRVAIVGDAAHTVPPTGAKGMNLAIADVVVLARGLEALLVDGDERLIDEFEDAVARRIWKAQHFSWWMTEMLHAAPNATDFDRHRQLGELRSVVESEAGRTLLAEGYTGWPFRVGA